MMRRGREELHALRTVAGEKYNRPCSCITARAAKHGRWSVRQTPTEWRRTIMTPNIRSIFEVTSLRVSANSRELAYAQSSRPPSDL